MTDLISERSTGNDGGVPTSKRSLVVQVVVMIALAALNVAAWAVIFSTNVQ